MILLRIHLVENAWLRNVFFRCLSTKFLDPSFVRDAALDPRTGIRPSSSSSDKISPPPVGFQRLTRRIKEHVFGAEGALRIVREHEHALNPIHFSAILTRLASASPSPCHHRISSSVQSVTFQQTSGQEELALNATFTLLERKLPGQLSLFKARQLANCCWGIAKLISRCRISLETASPLALEILKQASKPGSLAGADATDLSLIAWCAKTIRHNDERLLGALEEAASQMDLVAFKDHEIINLLKPFAAIRKPRPQILVRICSELFQDVPRLNAMEARHVSHLAFFCSAMQLNNWDFNTALVSRSKQILCQFSPAELCSLVTSLLSMQYMDADLMYLTKCRIGEVLRQNQTSLIHPVSALLLALFNFLPQAESVTVLAHELVISSFPMLSQTSGASDCAKAVLVFCAALRCGHLKRDEADLIKGSLLSVIQRLTTGLQEGRLSADTLSSLAQGLPLILSKIMAPTANPSDQVDGNLVERLRILDTYCISLRSATLLRLREMQPDGRPHALSALVQSADQIAGFKESR